MAITSLKTAPEIQRVPLQITPDHWLNLTNYFEVFKREPFLRYLLNSAIVASIAAVSSLVVSSLAGFGFAKYPLPRTGCLLPRHRRHPDGPLPVGRGAAIHLDEPSRAARYLHGHRGPGLGQRLRRLPDAAGHRDDSQRLHRRGPHRRLQRTPNLLLGDSAVGEAGHGHPADHQVHVELERVLLADGGDQQPHDEGGHHGPDELHQHVLHRVQPPHRRRGDQHPAHPAHLYHAAALGGPGRRDEWPEGLKSVKLLFKNFLQHQWLAKYSQIFFVHL